MTWLSDFFPNFILNYKAKKKLFFSNISKYFKKLN